MRLRSCHRPSDDRDTKATRRCLRSGCSHPADRRRARNIAGAGVRLRIIEGAVLEPLKIEIGTELALDAREQVEIELCREAGFVIVGGMKDARLLHQIDTDDQSCAASQHAPGMAQEFAGFLRLEI